MANINRRNSKDSSSWKGKISAILQSPSHSSTANKGDKETGTELRYVIDEGWDLLESLNLESKTMDPSQPSINGERDVSNSKPPLATSTPPLKKKTTRSSPSLGPRSSSLSGVRSPRSTGSPTSLQRSISSRNRKQTLEVAQNGHRGTSSGKSSPHSGRSSSPGRPKKSSLTTTGHSASPSTSTSDLTRINGKSVDPKDESSLASKIRDTLRISRPKKKKGTKSKGLAYSVTPVEINMNHSSKYTDPFETSFAENTDGKVGLDHDFKPASIPHNKPEYCDHCGETAWGLYRQVLKCSRCDFIVHRKCEPKVVLDCSSRIEGVLSHDKQVEDLEIMAANEEPEETPESPVPVVVLRNHSSGHHQSTESVNTESTSSTSSTVSSQMSSAQLLADKVKLSRKIREYNRKTTPVHHIHLRSSHNDPGLIEYQGFVRVHMCVQRPIHVSTAITRTSWYRLMRPVKERSTNADGMADGFETAFYLPTDTNRLVHIINTTTTKDLVSILLKKFCVTDNPKKFSLYEEYGTDSRRLFEEDHPLEIVLDGSSVHRNSKLVLRDNTYSTIQWDAFTQPELANFIEILKREEKVYINKLEARFAVWRQCISQALKDSCMEDVSRETKRNISNSKSDSTKPKRQLPSIPAKIGSVV